jgi:hypothetical protein
LPRGMTPGHRRSSSASRRCVARRQLEFLGREHELVGRRWRRRCHSHHSRRHLQARARRATRSPSIGRFVIVGHRPRVGVAESEQVALKEPNHKAKRLLGDDGARSGTRDGPRIVVAIVVLSSYLRQCGRERRCRCRQWHRPPEKGEESILATRPPPEKGERTIAPHPLPEMGEESIEATRPPS